MKLVDADKLRKQLEELENTADGKKDNARCNSTFHYLAGKLRAYEAVRSYLDAHEYDEGLTITHGEHGWFCEDDRGDIHGWDRESKQAAIDLYRKRRRMADAANRSGNPRS